MGEAGTVTHGHAVSPPRIVRTEIISASRPLRTRFSIFGGTTDAVESIFVRLTDECGCTGVGETTPMAAYSGVSVRRTRQELERLLLPAVKGVAATPTAVHAAMDATGSDAALAKAAVDLALFDVLGRHHGMSVADLLGGTRRASVPLAWVLGYMPVDALLAEAATAIDRGYATLKLKVGRDPERDVTAVRAVRAAWPGIRLRIDANQGYDVSTALAVLGRLDDAGLELVEQPIPAGRPAELATVRSRTGVAVMADESLQTLSDAFTLAAAGACDVFNVKILKPGGLFRARQVAAVAEAAGLPVMVGSMPELGVATAAGYQFACTLGELPYACELIGPQMISTDVVASGAPRFDGATGSLVSEQPGAGSGLTVDLPW